MLDSSSVPPAAPAAAQPFCDATDTQQRHNTAISGVTGQPGCQSDSIATSGGNERHLQVQGAIGAAAAASGAQLCCGALLQQQQRTADIAPPDI